MTITPHVDLRDQFGAARDQDPRPTCMAFAASDAHAAARGAWSPLSVEWAHYHAVQRRGGPPHGGVSLDTMMSTLEIDGQPLEGSWPYINQHIADLAAWKPPAVKELYKRCHALCNATIAGIVGELDKGRPVVFTTSLSPAFYRPQNGVVESAEPASLQPRHALIAVGHGVRKSSPFILVRNSWGDTWGMQGYAWVSTTYLQPRLLDAAAVTTEP
jgi:C1A family cysteine protease